MMSNKRGVTLTRSFVLEVARILSSDYSDGPHAAIMKRLCEALYLDVLHVENDPHLSFCVGDKVVLKSRSAMYPNLLKSAEKSHFFEHFEEGRSYTVTSWCATYDPRREHPPIHTQYPAGVNAAYASGTIVTHNQNDHFMNWITFEEVEGRWAEDDAFEHPPEEKLRIHMLSIEDTLARNKEFGDNLSYESWRPGSYSSKPEWKGRLDLEYKRWREAQGLADSGSAPITE